MSTLTPLLASALLQGPPLPAGPLGQALIAIIAIGIVILVGRIVLSIAWRLVLIASVIIGLLWLVSIVL